MWKVLVVDDSPTIRKVLCRLVQSDPGLELVGEAEDGQDAVDLNERLRPDVIVMDVHMPRMNGLDATRRIMESRPVPIIVVTASGQPEQVRRTFEAVEAGAVAFLDKPIGLRGAEGRVLEQRFLETVRAMAEVKVVRRWRRSPVPAPGRENFRTANRPRRVIAIGASTGGPQALRMVLSRLDPGLPVPILVVQHISPGFLPGLVEWLHTITGFPCRIGTHGGQALSGTAWFAPDGVHMGIDPNGRLVTSQDEPENGLRPSVAFLFRSVLAAYGAEAVAVLLTGMGSDGAEELRRIRQRGGYTLVQDEETSAVFGMPGAAVRLDAASVVLPPESIAASLNALCRGNVQSEGGNYGKP